MGRYIFLLALLVCSATSFAQPALADTSKLYFHDGKFSWRANLSTLKTYMGLPALGTAKQHLRVNAGATALEYSSTLSASSGIAAGTTSDPAASAILEAQSTTKGFLMPRMTNTQRDAISSPATGLMIYNTTTGSLESYNGTRWQRETASSGTPSFTIGSGWGTGATSSIVGDDISGKITVTSGTGSLTATTLGTVTFATAFPSGSAYSVFFANADDDARGANMHLTIPTTMGTSSYIANINNSNITARLSTSTGYEIFYHVIQYQ